MPDNGGTCLFLVLSLEIRQQIYGYLLTTKWTKEQALHKAPEFRRTQELVRRDPGVSPRSQHRPGHVYVFQTSILRTNRQINKEAEHVFHNWNQFVSIAHYYNRAPPFSYLLEHFKKEGIREIFEQRGFPIVAIDQAARNFKHYAMEVCVGQVSNAEKSVPTERWFTGRTRKEWRNESIFMIASSDLRQLCRVILELHRRIYGGNVRSQDRALVLIDVVTRGDQLTTCLKDGSIPVIAKVQRLLEPFRRLHSIAKVVIAGQINDEYNSEIVASMMRQPPTAEEMIHTACASKAEGDEAFRNNDFSSSLSAYEKAYNDIEAGHQYPSPFALIVEGKYAGSRVSSAKQHLLFTLRLDIVAALLQLHEYEEALNWAEMELYGNNDTISKGESARLWHLKSQASRGLGSSEAGFLELVHAVLHDPDNEVVAADLGVVTANVLKSSAARIKWTPSSETFRVNRRRGAGRA